MGQVSSPNPGANLQQARWSELNADIRQAMCGPGMVLHNSRGGPRAYRTWVGAVGPPVPIQAPAAATLAGQTRRIGDVWRWAYSVNNVTDTLIGAPKRQQRHGQVSANPDSQDQCSEG